MKFIHTSDWHLGRQFHNVSLLDDQQAVLDQLIQYIENNPVDAVVVAGDIYDRSVPPTIAIELLNKVVKRICGELNTPMILISGNHDGAERLGFGSEQMKNAGLHIISNFEDMLTPVVIETESAGQVAFYGMPYNDPEQVRFVYQEPVSTHDQAHKLLAEKITEQFQPEQRNVLVSHCFVDGAIESESERPLSIGGSDRVSHEHFLNFDYVALGHLHQPQKKGEEYIRYSGSLMKYSFGEQNQKKGFTLVEIDQNGFVSAEHIDLAAPHEMRIVEGELEQVIEQGKTDPKNEDYLLVRLMDKHAILNPMEKLRTVYPNVLHLEKPGMLIGVEQEMAQAKLARSEIDMFRDFFTEAQDSQLSQEQDQAISDIIKQLSQQAQ
ncbi:SbcCD cleaves DNA hairpin structures. These structures can inhibit DNA replication and are intermediates in certain DNA recombination reactions. The complex acts as a 3'- 5' double strand exonuclease that can open hairpins. It also has a 5' single-strand endonuclease activity [Vibrio sp. B1FIG11]|uniref:exonuclease SbcCD subunit D n=1 Tax=Vibrio sp. B1FIG11 TaxID=2751177 RepID=UPI001AF971A7|nr:exonuclease SbcCD subunit D [Vibrio sp. B1FIG11]CAD7824537.1 SbcCD cleaves DNA hairpin structures. These structures can inhibit DNA replication and are intermediates in certain DNA recombination reactions. The complex acts as a 3'- 5' double strand exonuclease that can open hairpins. It also has a 5' single-strand endonuclease activity [Vibrio sp. B1FIG11]CAE6952729.1 SbcCD cleaves DNA hairpin structures. These structures can inhibit DNA replication and are intermediates in certain DNA recombi